MPGLLLKPLDLRDEHIVQHLLDHMTAYSMRVDGVPRVDGAARRFLTAVPSGCAASSKNAFAVMHDNEPVGLIDLIDGYPETSIVFIGLLAIREDSQQKGFGRRAYELAQEFAQKRLHATKIRLGVVETNPVVGFWKKMGFTETGEVKPYTGEGIISKALILEKAINVPGSPRALK